MVPTRWRRASGLLRRHILAGVVGLCTVSLTVAVIVVPGGERAGGKNPGVTAPDRPDGRKMVAAAEVSVSPSITPTESVSPTESSSPAPTPLPIASGVSESPVLSADGRFVAFWSSATNLVSGDTNRATDAFVTDLETGGIKRVSVTDDGLQANGDSYPYSMSADGNLIVFSSAATNLIPGLTPSSEHLYIHNIRTNKNTMIDVTPTGDPGHRGPAPGCCMMGGKDAVISEDGRYVAFVSLDDNLVEGDTNQGFDVFVRDLVAGTTERVSVSSSGEQAKGGGSPLEFDFPSVSDDGRWVSFVSDASNLVSGTDPYQYSLFIRDRASGSTQLVEKDASSGSVSADGRFVGYQIGSTYLWDTSDATRTQVDAAPENVEVNLFDVSATASVLLWAENLNNQGMKDEVVALSRATGTHHRLDTTGYLNGGNLVISRDGSTVAFSTNESSRLQISLPWGKNFIEVCTVQTDTCRIASNPS
jgi:hypothetical protein